MNNLAPAADPPQKQMRVLIVEDDEHTAWAMTDLLEELDCATLVVGEGTQACRLACEFQPDIALLDIDLPGLNGFEVAQAMRRTPELSGVTIIAITGRTEPEDKEKAYRMGMDLHLAKPLQLNFFKALIADFTKTHRSFAAAALLNPPPCEKLAPCLTSGGVK